MKKSFRFLILFVLLLVILIMAAPLLFAVGADTPNIAKGAWWVMTALISIVMAYLNFSKKYMGTVPAKVLLIINVASAVFGIIFATPWAPPAGP